METILSPQNKLVQDSDRNEGNGYPVPDSNKTKIDLHTHVYCSAIHSSQVMETTRCHITDEWIKKMWYLYAMEFYSAMKKNVILSFAGKWMELESIILSEVSQAQTKNCVFSLICGL
jgi:hypothetical protein